MQPKFFAMCFLQRTCWQRKSFIIRVVAVKLSKREHLLLRDLLQVRVVTCEIHVNKASISLFFILYQRS